MNAETDIIILKREPGPVAGTLSVTVDAPGLKQAVFVVSEHLKDTAEERVVLASMVATRTQAAHDAKWGQI